MTHVKNNTGNDEWYTQRQYILSAIAVMGGIDCDPASNDIAQNTVKATTYYTKETDGLSQYWFGRVWMNPPYSSKLIQPFCQRLTDLYSICAVTEFITLTNNATETKWFDSLMSVASCVCLVKGRIRFVSPDGALGKTPLQGQCFIYAGENKDKFQTEFSKYGKVLHART